jgi:hypothetical protein
MTFHFTLSPCWIFFQSIFRYKFLLYFLRSRKRRTSYTDERDDMFDGDDMDECNAALVLMSLSCSPNSPRQGECLLLNLSTLNLASFKRTTKHNIWTCWHSNVDLYSTAWEGALLGSSPNDSIETFSGSSSPPLSDDGNVSSSSTSSSDQKYILKQNHHKLQINQFNLMEHQARRGQRTTSLSTSDEGIVMDYGEEMPRKRRVSSLHFLFISMIFDCRIKWAQKSSQSATVSAAKTARGLFSCV